MLWHSLANICIELPASGYVGYQENIHTLMKTENVLVDIWYQMMYKKSLTRSNSATGIAFSCSDKNENTSELATVTIVYYVAIAHEQMPSKSNIDEH